MKLVGAVIENFRSYRERTYVPIDDLTVFVGKNDAGKSTILEALEVFFNNETVKLDKDDRCVHGTTDEIRIGCIFDDFPETLVIDSAAETSLQSEYLLNADGLLEIHKTFKNGKPTGVVAWANHPTADNVDDLLGLKIAELRARLTTVGADTDAVNKNISSEIRAAIRAQVADLELNDVEIPLKDGDGKAVWEKLSESLPVYALFKADRASQDQDGEVQNPLKAAIAEAVKTVESQVEEIRQAVRDHVSQVADRTIEKLGDFDEDIAKALDPDFKEKKLESIFSYSLLGDDGIPINKRGSGVRRLILLSFFRAEAELKTEAVSAPNVIYAVEEPESSQHPDNQRLLMESFKTLAETGNCQVLLTTHVPAIAALAPTTSLRLVEDGSTAKSIGSDDDAIYSRIATSLGVLPNYGDTKIKAIVCVEGPTDVTFIQHVSTLYEGDESVPNLTMDDRVLLLHVGGSNLVDWVRRNSLQGLNIPEYHLYDRGDGSDADYSDFVDAVNNRDNGSSARLTNRREIENYIPARAWNELFGVDISIDADEDVISQIARHVADTEHGNGYFDGLTSKPRKTRRNNVKKAIHESAVPTITLPELTEMGVSEEIKMWLTDIGNLLNGNSVTQ